jgi:hypothetical protein
MNEGEEINAHAVLCSVQMRHVILLLNTGRSFSAVMFMLTDVLCCGKCFFGHVMFR